MRGKVKLVPPLLLLYGITPAYAGKRKKIRRIIFLSGDHPRLCGEKRITELAGDVVIGSPPPMRGKAELMIKLAEGLRITPAYAGKSLFTPFAKSRCKDHPRLCGEKRKIVDHTLT